MRNRMTPPMLAAALLLAGGAAQAQPIEATYRCHVIGDARPEPIGDREHHALQVVQYTCAGEGFAQGAVQTGWLAYEWDGPRAVGLFGATVARRPGGYGVTVQTDMRNELLMADGKVVGIAARGRGEVKLGTGDFAPAHGRRFSYTSRADGPGRFVTMVTFD